MSEHEIRIGGGGVVVQSKPIWSAARFALILGKEAFSAMEAASAGSADLRYAKYVLERSNIVDMNDPDVLAMIESLSPSIISAEKLAVLKGE